MLFGGGRDVRFLPQRCREAEGAEKEVRWNESGGRMGAQVGFWFWQREWPELRGQSEAGACSQFAA